MTKNQKAYQKEIKRLQRGIKRAEKKGYFVDYDFVLPKRVTKKRLSEIQKLRPRDIYQKGVKVDIDTGEVLGKAKEFIYKRTKKDRSEKSQEIRYNDDILADIIINNLIDSLSFAPHLHSQSKRYVDIAINKYGKVELAKRIQAVEVTITELLYSGIVPSNEVVPYYFSELIGHVSAVLEFSESDRQSSEDEFESFSGDWNDL